MAVVYNGKHYRNPSGHNNRVKWLLSMSDWDAIKLLVVIDNIKDVATWNDDKAHAAWKKRWADACKEARWHIKVIPKYYREIMRLRDGNRRAVLRIADLQHELSKYEGMCVRCKRGQDEHR